jgi:hypothetical protein
MRRGIEMGRGVGMMGDTAMEADGVGEEEEEEDMVVGEVGEVVVLEAEEGVVGGLEGIGELLGENVMKAALVGYNGVSLP